MPEGLAAQDSVQRPSVRHHHAAPVQHTLTASPNGHGAVCCVLDRDPRTAPMVLVLVLVLVLCAVCWTVYAQPTGRGGRLCPVMSLKCPMMSYYFHISAVQVV